MVKKDMPISKATVLVFLVVLLFICFLMVELFWVFITPIVLALVLTSIFQPFYRWLLGICFGYKHVAAFIAILAIIIVVTIPFSIFIASLTQEALVFYKSSVNNSFFEDFNFNFSIQNPIIIKIQGFAMSYGIDISPEKIISYITQVVGSFGHMLYNNLSELPSNALAMVFNFLVTILLVFTFLITGSDLKQYLMEISPLPIEEEERLLKQFRTISNAVFVGNGIVGIAEGVLGGLAFYLFGLGPALFWGVLIALSSFLPIVGAFIVVIPATFVLYVKGEPSLAFAYLFFNVIYLSILELVIKPLLIGGKSRLNAVLVLLSVIGGIKIFGVLGIFYGPLVVTMFLSLMEIYKDHYREKLIKQEGFK